MNDEVLVRIGDCRAYLAEERQAFGRGERIRVAVGVDRFAVHVFHDEIRESVVGRPAVDQARDIRMIELRQNLPLGAETPDDIVRVEPAPNDLDRDLFPILVVRSRGQVNGAQSAAADLADESVGAELPADESARPPAVGKQIARNCEGRFFDEAAGLFVRFEERIDFSAEIVVAAAFLVEESRRVGSGSRSAAASNSFLMRAQRSLAGGIGFSLHDFPAQPRFGDSPFSFHGPRGNIQHLADFFVR